MEQNPGNWIHFIQQTGVLLEVNIRFGIIQTMKDVLPMFQNILPETNLKNFPGPIMELYQKFVLKAGVVLPGHLQLVILLKHFTETTFLQNLRGEITAQLATKFLLKTKDKFFDA